MFDIGWQELFIVAVLALIVVGPKDLPQAIRTMTSWIRKAKMMARDFQAGVNEMVREAELEDLKDHLVQPGDLKKTITNMIDADGELAKGLTLTDEDVSTPKAMPLGQIEDEVGTADPLKGVSPPTEEDVMPVDNAKTDDKA